VGKGFKYHEDDIISHRFENTVFWVQDVLFSYPDNTCEM